MSKLMCSRIPGLAAVAASLIINLGVKRRIGCRSNGRHYSVEGCSRHAGPPECGFRQLAVICSEREQQHIGRRGPQKQQAREAVAGQRRFTHCVCARLNRIFVGNGEGVCNASMVGLLPDQIGSGA